MRAAVHAEWTKLRTSPGMLWLLPGIVAATIGVGAFAGCEGAHCDAVRSSLTGVQLGQAVVAMLATFMMGNEYSTGMIRATLTAMPRRLEVLAAKAVVLVGAVTVAGSVAVIGAGRLAHGRATVGSVLYLILVGLLGLGVTAVVRQPAAAIGVVLGLLYVFPILASAVPDETWQRNLQKIGPMSAGLSIQATKGLAALPIAPWAGLAVLAAWAAAAMFLGGLVFRLRDA